MYGPILGCVRGNVMYEVSLALMWIGGFLMGLAAGLALGKHLY